MRSFFCLSLLLLSAYSGFAQADSMQSFLRSIESELNSSIAISEQLETRLTEREQQVTSLSQQLLTSSAEAASIKHELSQLRSDREYWLARSKQLASLASQLRKDLTETQTAHETSLADSEQQGIAFEQLQTAWESELFTWKVTSFVAVGAGAGYAIGGPLGALIGAGVGALAGIGIALIF